MEHDAGELALEVADVGLRNIPKSAPLLTVRGAINGTLGNLDSATADFQAAERLVPDKMYGSAGLSMLLQQAGKIDHAIDLLRDRLRNAPDDPTLNFLLADSLLRKEDQPDHRRMDEIRSALWRAVRAKPDFAKAHAELGKLYVKTGEPEQAVSEFRIALKLDPDHRIALSQLAAVLNRLNRTAEARDVAANLRDVLRKDREAEANRNRTKLIKTPAER